MNRKKSHRRRRRKMIRIALLSFSMLVLVLVLVISGLVISRKIRQVAEKKGNGDSSDQQVLQTEEAEAFAAKSGTEITAAETVSAAEINAEELASEESASEESASEETAEDSDGWLTAADLDSITDNGTLIVSQDPEMYTYTDMLNDMKVLLTEYPDVLSVKDAAQTADQREIWLFRIGSESASNKVLIHAGIHAREYITCQLVMKQMADFLSSYSNQESYKNYTLADLMNDTALYIIPMINPDGASISQLGLEGVQTEETMNLLEQIAAADGCSLSDSSYLTYWKANARGIDLNRQFDALWDQYAGAGHISSDHYKGDSIGCEAESALLIQLTEDYLFDRTISYHTQGDVVYWYFAQEEPLYSATYTFAQRIGNLTGYWLDANYQNLDPAGYKDWCVYKMDIPSLTIEVGTETSPVPAYQFQQIWQENRYVFQETLIDLIENPYKPQGASTSSPDAGTSQSDTGTSQSQAGAQEADGTQMVADNGSASIPLLCQADPSAEAVAEVPSGSTVTYIGDGFNGYSLVSYNGTNGYILTEYLK